MWHIYSAPIYPYYVRLSPVDVKREWYAVYFDNLSFSFNAAAAHQKK
jgi:hypothetical protein